MTTRLIVSIVALHAVTAFASTNEMLDYLKPILGQQVTSAGDAWTYSGQGGYLFRFNLDVTGDGLPEMFLTSSLNFQKFNGPWQVFKALPDGSFQPYSGQVDLNPTGFWLSTENNGTAIVQSFHDRWSSDENREVIVTTSFLGDRIVTGTTRFMDDPTSELQTQGKIVAYTPDVLGVLLVDFLKDPDHSKWAQIDFNHPAPNPADYFVCPRDVERIKSLGYFTPQLALEWLEGKMRRRTGAMATLSLTVETPANLTKSNAVSGSRVTADAALKQVATSSGTTESRQSVWLSRIPALEAIGLVALFALGLFALKKHF